MFEHRNVAMRLGEDSETRMRWAAGAVAHWEFQSGFPEDYPAQGLGLSCNDAWNETYKTLLLMD